MAQRVQGTLTLTAGVRCTVDRHGAARRGQRCVIVKLTRGPTGYDVIREQRHLSQDLPGLETPARLKWHLADAASRRHSQPGNADSSRPVFGV